MSPLPERLLLGALAGFAATLPMTAAMRRLHRRLPASERYPLPPREISQDLPALGMRRSAATLLHHFMYGGAAGSVFALLHRRDAATGSAFGIAVWMVSYLGWIPAARILRFGTEHPPRRNGLMLIAHLVWGMCLAASMRELELAEATSFSRSTSPHPRLIDRAEETR